MKDQTRTPPLAYRIFWFALLWGSGVLAVSVLGLIIKLALK